MCGKTGSVFRATAGSLGACDFRSVTAHQSMRWAKTRITSCSWSSGGASTPAVASTVRWALSFLTVIFYPTHTHALAGTPFSNLLFRCTQFLSLCSHEGQSVLFVHRQHHIQVVFRWDPDCKVCSQTASQPNCPKAHIAFCFLCVKVCSQAVTAKLSKSTHSILFLCSGGS